MFSKKQLKKLFEKFHIKLWWLDIVYPVLLCFLLLCGLSYLFYTGQKHRRIASHFEERLIHLSLSWASPRKVLTKDKILTVSLQESDLKHLSPQRHQGFINTSIEVYAKVIDRLVDAGLKKIFIYWQPLAFSKPENYILLQKAIKRAKQHNTKVYLGVHPSLVKSLPENIAKKKYVLEGDPCQSSIQLMCVYNSPWDRWIMQVIADKTSTKHVAHSNTLPAFVSHQLPRLLPSYLLYYNDYKDFKELSFTDLLNTVDKFNHYDFAFVGNNISQGNKNMSKSVDVGRVKTILDSTYKPTRTHATPMHKLWAQHTQMFLDEATVEMLSLPYGLVLCLLLVGLLVALIYFYGTALALGAYLLFILWSPLINALTIYFLSLYIPLVHTLYAGLASFILLAFAKLSHESFCHWRLHFQQEADKEALDVKSNFLSLISHNLNTPVAKMQGLFSMLDSITKDPHSSLDTQHVQTLLAQMRLTILFVLVNTSLEDRQLNIVSYPLTSLLQDFQQTMLKALQRLGVDLTVQVENNESSKLPVKFDSRIFNSALAALVLLHYNLKTKPTSLHLSICEDLDTANLKLSAHLETQEDGKKTSCHPPFEGGTKSLSLLQEVGKQLLEAFCQTHKGRFTLHKNQSFLEVLSF